MPNHVMIIRLWTASEKGSRDHEISKARDRAGHLTQRFLPIRRVSVRNRTETVPDLCVELPLNRLFAQGAQLSDHRFQHRQMM